MPPLWLRDGLIADEYGTNTLPHYHHSMLYWTRDVSRQLAEEACARDDYGLARQCVQRAARVDARLREYACTGCVICPGVPSSTDRAPQWPLAFESPEA